MKTCRKLFLLLLIPALGMIAMTSCNPDDSDKLSGTIGDANAVDVSSRITGFNSNVTGPGATLVANGTNLSSVKRVVMGGASSPSVVSAESTVTFTVPFEVSFGVQEVVFIFAGNERATASIEVVPLPVIEYVSPLATNSGDEIVVIGNNLDIVENVDIGGVSATITQKEKDILAFTSPAGPATGSTFTLESPAGNVAANDLFISCDAEPDVLLCFDPLNPNGGFEEGPAGDVTEIGNPPGWGFSGAGSLADIDVITWRDGPTRHMRQALRVEILDVGANPWNIEVREETFNVSPNTNYLYTVLVRGPEGARVDFTIGLPDFSELGRNEATLTGDWELITVEFSTGPDQTEIRTPIHFSRAENIGYVFYLDNMRVVQADGALPCTFESDPECFCGENPDDPRCGPPPINLNGGFEESEVGVIGDGMGQISVDNWGFAGNGSLANMEIVDDMTASGDRALKVEILDLGQDPWNIEIRQEGIPVDPMTTYVYSIMVKGTGGQVNFTVGNPDFNEFGRVEYSDFNGEWQEITFEFTTGEMDTELRTPMHVSIEGNIDQVYYFDDLKITPQG